MRNLEKFLRENNIKYNLSEDKNYLRFSINNDSFFIHRVESSSGVSARGQRFGNPQGYRVRVNSKRSNYYKTQLDIIGDLKRIYKIN